MNEHWVYQLKQLNFSTASFGMRHNDGNDWRIVPGVFLAL